MPISRCAEVKKCPRELTAGTEMRIFRPPVAFLRPATILDVLSASLEL